ncbi:MAG TPA: PLP-dependent aminotransferase family protein [Candidatus Cybelea sp.]|nr:PLP-dependent aminotransferase family protein [Candidatus Cybelea sp.]
MTTMGRGESRASVLPLIAVDRSAPRPLHKQIYEAYRARILGGNLRAGQRVPSTRTLASELGISRIPVLNAYAQLVAEGYFESRVGSGTFISRAMPERSLSFENHPATPRRPRRSGPRPIAASASALARYEAPPWVLGRGAFNVGQPALDAFPFPIWSNLVSRYARNLQLRALAYGRPLGLDELRAAIAEYLQTARAVRCEPQQIMIVNGSQQALDISSRVLLNPGSPAWVEEPGYWLVRNSLITLGARIVPVPVDGEGLDVTAGIKLCSRARVAYVAPSHQFPLGVTMSASRRLQLLDWAQSTGAWVVEDDYDSEYRYESMPVASLQGLDRHSRVIYIGTFSKVLFPSLRLGYVVMPPDLVDRFMAVRNAMDICPSHLQQAVLADFITEGHFLRHIRRMRLLYGERRAVLVDSIRAEFGSSWQVTGAEAGLHVVLLLPRGLRDREICVRAAERKVWLWPLSPSYLRSPRRQGFILGFASATPPAIPAAVRVMSSAAGAG